MDGHGHDLAALPIRGDALDVPADLVLNQSRSESPPVLEEHVSRSTGKAEKLAAGEAYTPWTGLALLGDRLLAAAGPRGLLVLSASAFSPDTKAEPIDLGGPVHDVVAVDDRAYALVGGETNDALVFLAFSPDGPPHTERMELPGHWQRIVD
jgi:hypothetical protein